MARKLSYLLCGFLLLMLSQSKGQSLFYVSGGTDVTVKSGTDFSNGGLVLTPSADLTLTELELTKALTPTHPISVSLIAAVYQFSDTVQGYNGTVRINYDEADLNGISESQLYLNVYDGTRWRSYTPSTRDGVNNYVEYTSFSGLSIQETALGAIIPPVITVTGSLTRFTYCPTTASSEQTFTVSGSDIYDPIGIKAPTGFEISETSGSGYTDSITYIPTSGNVGTQTVYVRVKDNATGAVSGNITVSSPGATTRTIAVYAATDNALKFDGTNDYVDCGKPTATRITNNFTIGAWIKTSLAAQRTFLTNQWKYHTSGILLGLTGTGKLHIAYTANSSGNWTYRDPDIVLSDGKWHYVVVSFESGRLRTYVDSVLIDNFLTAYTTVYYSGIPNLVIGKDGGDGAEHWNGSIDEVSIWSKVLSQSEVTSTMVDGITGSESNLVLYYDFNQGTAEGTNTGLDSLIDRSSSIIKGTLTNMALTGSTSNWVKGHLSEISGSNAVCVGSTLQLVNPLTGGSWTSSNTAIASVNSSTGLVTGVGGGSATITYDLCGRQVTKSITVTSNVSPSVSIASSDADNAICSGTRVTFTATPTNGGTPSYQWKLNGNNVGGDSAKYVTDTLRNGDVVKVVLTSSVTCVTSSTAESNTITTTVNSNFTPSVSIASSDNDNTICSGASVTFTATPTNGGTPSYQWKLNGSNVGTNSATYTSSTLSNADTVKVVMTSNVTCVTSSTAQSNTITTTVISAGSNGLWLGNTSTSWIDGSNWCGGSAPADGSSITIPAGLTNYPILNGNVSITDLELASGATLSLNGNELTVTGNLSGTGRFIGSSTSSLVYGGSGSSDTLYFSSTTPGSTDALSDLTYNRSGQTLTVGNTLQVYGVITPTAGTLNANGNLVLKSNAGGTARIAAGSGTYITGEVTVERYLPDRGRTYRLLAPTVNTSGSIRTNWMENGLNTSIGVNNDPNPGYGTQITGLSGNVNGFDVTGSNQPSLYLTTNGVAPTYTAVNSTSGTLNAKTGYFLFVRGDRSMDMTQNNTNVPPNPQPLIGSSTTLRTKGTLVTGTVNSFTNAFSSTTDALNLVTNPYASPISWASVYGASSNITDYYTLWDPSIGYRGGFVTVSSGGVVSAGSATTVIQSGQAFFVQSTGSGTPTVVIEEAHKTSGNSNAVFAPTVLPKASLQASIYYKEASGYRRLADGVLLQMDAAFSNAVNSGDAAEIMNWDENLAILQGGKRLAIEQRSIPTASDTLNLFISNMKRMTYEMEVKTQGMADASLQPYLIDRFTGAQTLLKNNESTIVPFSVTSNSASSASNRFYVIFKNSGTLPVRIVQFKASAKDKSVQVNWQVEEDESVDHYEVERSKDQSIFNKIGTQMASGNSVATASFTLMDNDPFTGNNFYRLKLVEKSGDIKYSKVERVTFSGRSWSVSVFPNPFSGTELQLKLDQWPAGNYRISITDVLGRVVYNRMIETQGGNLIIPIGLKGELSSLKANAGVYWLKIEGNGIEEVRKVMRE